jgi:hypothetical protein
MVNQLSEALKPWENEEGEYADSRIEAVYLAIAYNPVYSTMQVHSDLLSIMDGHNIRTVESCYFMCHRCGFVVPAHPVDRGKS